MGRIRIRVKILWVRNTAGQVNRYLVPYLASRDDVLVLQLDGEGDPDLLLEGGQRRQRPRGENNGAGAQLGQPNKKIQFF